MRWIGCGRGDGGTVENVDRKLAGNRLAQSCKHCWSGGGNDYVLDGAHCLLECDDLADDPGENNECEEEEYLTVVNSPHCGMVKCSKLHKGGDKS